MTKPRRGSSLNLTDPRVRVGEQLERCIYCDAGDIIRKGHRKKKFELVQLWRCRRCKRTFTAQQASGKTYPLKVILECLMLFYLGETRDRTASRIRERFGIAVPLRTLSSWIAEYRDLTAYARMREAGRVAFPARWIVRSVRLQHKQVYKYCVHQGKLALSLELPAQQAFAPIAHYLSTMLTSCPHNLFLGDSRASQAGAAFDLDGVQIRAAQNHACRLAHLVLQTVTINKRRHDELQRFMLLTDSATIAVEVPIFLTTEDIAALRASGLTVPIETTEPLTGHIDVLQIRNGKIYILDYKPRADKERPIAQLMVYALALSRRTGIGLFNFVCAWFDEKDYFEFYPLHVVRKRTDA